MKQKQRGFCWVLFWLFATGCCALALAFAAVQNAQTAAAQSKTAEIVIPASSALTGMVIAIDPGHGGYDGGTIGRKTHVKEKDLNLDVALCLRDLLRSQGARIIMTREGDYALCDDAPPVRKKLQDMQRRAALIVQGKADLVLSIHMNEYSGSRSSGPQVFFRKDCPAGKLLAAQLQHMMNGRLQPDRARDINTGDYYILTLGLPSALVECGFLSNATEEAKLRDPVYRARVALSICEGVLAWAAMEQKPMPLAAQQR